MKDSRLIGSPVSPAWPRLLLAAMLAFLTVPFAPAPAQAADDITGRLRAGEDVVLDGDAVVRLGDGEEIVYGGHFSGVGTLTVGGSGTLILTADSDFTIPEDRQTQTVEVVGEPWRWSRIENPDPPAVTVEAGATLQYGDGTGSTGLIGHYPYDTPDFAWNALNHRVDGTLIVAVHGPRYHPGNLSGSGYIVQPRFTWDGLALAGDHTFSGTLYNGTGVHFSDRAYQSRLPDVEKILNQGSFIVNNQRENETVLGMDFYSREWGNDINFHSALDGTKVVMTGQYSWADSGSDADPSLSDPSLNYEVVAHNHNKRGINIEGATVQWGDGTTDRFFLPGNRDTVYINLHGANHDQRGHLIFDYNGPVQLDAPISGGIYHATMDAPGWGDVTIAGTPGNVMTFADQQNYDGATTIEAEAVLRLGTGEDGGDAWLLTGGERTEVVDEGALVVDNFDTDIELEDISGSGSLEQAGAATLRLTGNTGYTGATTVSDGTLALTGGDIAASTSVDLTGDHAVLDLSQVEDQTVADLGGVAGAVLKLGGDDLNVAGAEDTAYAGGVEGEGGLVKSGPGTWTYSGVSTAAGEWTVAEGALALDGAELAGDLTIDTGGDPASNTAPDSTLDAAAESAADSATDPAAGNGLTVASASSVGGSLTLGESSALTVGTGGGLAVGGAAVLGGTLSIAYEEGAALPEEITVVTAEGGVSGTFDGLAQDAELAVGDATYRVSYEDGRVVLKTDSPQEAAEAAAANGTGAAGLPWWAYVIGGCIVLLLLGLGLLVWLRRRRRGGGAGSDGGGGNVGGDGAGEAAGDTTMELPILRPRT